MKPSLPIPGDLFSQVSDGWAAYADTLSFGITSHIRQGLGYDTVDYGSTGYFVGRWVGVGHGFLLGYKAGGAAPEGYCAYLAWRAAQGYTAAVAVYGVGHSSYVLATDPQNFGFVDALGFVPVGGYVKAKGVRATSCGGPPAAVQQRPESRTASIRQGNLFVGLRNPVHITTSQSPLTL